MKKNYLSKFSLGTASFGNIYGLLNKNKFIKLEEAREIINLFFKNGGFQIDTSSGYGDSEKILGLILKDFKNYNFEVTTKFIVTKKSKLKDIKLQIDNSYRIFGDNLESVLCHTPNVISQDLRNIVLEAFEYINNNYKFKKGLSIYSSSELRNLDSIFRNNINAIQAPLNIFDNTADILKKEKLIALDSKVTARSIYLQGFLISEECILSRFKEQHDLYKNFCINKQMSKKEICIRYILQKKCVDSFAIGINNLNHLIELIDLLEKINTNQKNTFIKSLETENLDPFLIDPREW